MATSYEYEHTKAIKSWFLVNQILSSDLPARISRQWYGVAMPLRYDRPIEDRDPKVAREIFDPDTITEMEDAVDIDAEDAIKALRLFGRLEAAEWWEAHIGESKLTGFVFSFDDGIWMPLQVAHIRMPELEAFDQAL